MLTGIRFKAYPTTDQARRLSQWIGCARVIWNAKCEEDRYLRTFARRYLPVGTFPPIDKSYSQYKGEETAWLRDCPSQILRNSATIWANTYQNFLKGRCGRPRQKNRLRGNYIWLTRELFEIEQVDGRWLLHIGTQRNSLGVLSVKWHKKPNQLPNSLWIRVEHGRWTVSFSYEDNIDAGKLMDLEEHLAWLRTTSVDELKEMVTGIDRGVARPIQTQDETICPTEIALVRQQRRERYIRRLQRRLARQAKGSNRRKKTLAQIAQQHRTTKNVREDFLHKASRKIADTAKVVVLEDLRLKGMTRRAKPKQCPTTGRWLRNGASAKTGLNKALLGVGLFRFEVMLKYKMERANKPVFKVPAYNTSRECAACGHTHESNRLSQARFHCQSCGHTDNADRNAACVIAKRAIDLISDSGTELSDRGVLRRLEQAGGAASNADKTRGGKPPRAQRAASKKTRVSGRLQAAA